jgi:hypothetical protein
MLRYFILMTYNNGKNTKFQKINAFDWIHVFLSHRHIMNIGKLRFSGTRTGKFYKMVIFHPK